jgi:hypothetical protein
MVLITLHDLPSGNADAQLRPADRRSFSRPYSHPRDCDFVEHSPPLNARLLPDLGADVFDLNRYSKRWLAALGAADPTRTCREGQQREGDIVNRQRAGSAPIAGP